MSTSPNDLEAILGKVDHCILRTEIAVREATRAGDLAEETRELVREMKGLVVKLGTEQVSMRHGFPVTWVGRGALVVFAAAVGALVGVAACTFH